MLIAENVDPGIYFWLEESVQIMKPVLTMTDQRAFLQCRCQRMLNVNVEESFVHPETI